ncbi:MAG: 3'-5' exonuclease [Cyanobacteria bacterium P01_G01_bin.49]
MIEVNNCLIIDTETNRNQEQQTVLEIGAILYSVKYQTMLSCGSSLLYVDPDTKNEAFLINKIPIESTNTFVAKSYLIEWLVYAQIESDVIVAHNKSFDQPLVSDLPFAGFWDKPWLCTYKDFELFPEAYTGKRDLFSLAQFYGIGINISHRAINDCLLLAEVFNRVPELPEQFRIAQLPMIEAVCPKSDESLKEKGFRWDYQRQGWFKKDKDETFDFPTIKVTEDRHLFRALVSYNDRQIAKDWGFLWDSDRKVWERLLSPQSIELIPFRVAQMVSELESNS